MSILKSIRDRFYGESTPRQTDSGNLNPITMVELIEKISTLNASFMANLEQFAKQGNKAAGLRARKVSLELEKLIKEFRKRSVHETCGK